MAVLAVQDHTKVRVSSINDLPASVVAELEVYFQLNRQQASSLIDQGMSVGDMQQLAREMHKRTYFH